MRLFCCFILCPFLAASAVAAEPQPQPAQADAFEQTVAPVMQRYCADCHSEASGSDVLFADAAGADAIASARSLWHSVAVQLRNRTMPPGDAAQPSEPERLRMAAWIEQTLRDTACNGADYAGTILARRLNRNEYENTIRDLVGVQLGFSQTLPVDSGGGEGFDNNGETLFLPPLLMERYLEAAQQIVDAAILSPPLELDFSPGDLVNDRTDGHEPLALVPIAVEGTYRISVEIEPPAGNPTVLVFIDGIAAETLTFGDRRGPQAADRHQQQAEVRLTRGLHAVSLHESDNLPLGLVGINVQQQVEAPSPQQLVVHRQLLGLDPGETPAKPRSFARRFLRRFASRAFRRPATDGEVQRLMALYDRADARGDAFEQRIKLAMKGVLVSPDFLFRIEQPAPSNRIELITDYELATRLSYFLWSTLPDAELMRLASKGALNDPHTISAQVDRMLDDPRSEALFETFVGQWLGTRDVGGSVAPTDNGIQDFYTPDIATDMRREAVLLFQHIVRENRDLRELIDADYTFVTGRLAKFYGIDGADDLPRDQFQQVAIADGRRGGVLGLGAVLALTSHTAARQTSPVLRGAWVLDTLLGTPVPPPPPDVPPLDESRRKQQKLTLRQSLQEHRDHTACAACHDLIDPIGFGLENFDFLGRWRDEEGGQAIDARGTMPSGESFDGPAELRQILLQRRDEFARQVSRKLLGYALGRSLVDNDLCTIERLIEHLQDNQYQARSLIHAITLSTPFRYRQGDAPPKSP